LPAAHESWRGPRWPGLVNRSARRRPRTARAPGDAGRSAAHRGSRVVRRDKGRQVASAQSPSAG
jgi:hypothetical protein